MYPFIPPPKECIVCRDEIFNDEYPSSPTTAKCAANHQINTCLACLARHIEAETNQKGEIDVRCPILTCREHLDHSDVQRLATKFVFERYDTLLLRRSLREMEDFRWCKIASCGNGQIHDGGADYPIMICSACGDKSCFIHDVPWHSNETCEMFDERMAANVDDMASIAYKLRSTKPCPSCGNSIEKNGGCDHMTCRKPGGCGHEFCWLCLASYDRILQQGNHFHRETCHYWAPPEDEEAVGSWEGDEDGWEEE